MKSLHEYYRVSLTVGILALTLMATSAIAAAAPIKIACIGDSITWGYGTPHRQKNDYPAVLQKLLGSHYRVVNFGHGWATALKNPTAPSLSYWKVPQFKQATKFEPNIVTIMLGTNDSNPFNKSKARQFPIDLTALIHHFQTLSSHPQVFLCLPPSLEDGSIKGPNQPMPTHGIVAAVVRVARKMHLPIINTFHAVAGKWNLLNGDHIHPNKKGYRVIAHVIYKAIIAHGEQK